MFRQTLTITWKELQLLIRDKGALFVLFLMPLLLATIIGGPSSLGKRTAETAAGEEPALQVAVYLVNQDSGPYGAEVVKALQGIDVLQIAEAASLEAADSEVAEGKRPAAIVIPSDFTQQIGAGQPTAIQIIADPTQQQATGIVAGIVNQAVAEFGTAAEIRYGIRSVLEQSGALDGAPEEAWQAAEAQTMGVIWTQVQQIRQSPVIAVRSEDLKGTQTRPASGPMDWYISGFAVMFAFFAVTVVSPTMLQERERGTFRRLLATPIHRASMIAGVMLAYTLVVLLQFIFMFTVGRLIFGINLGNSLLGVGLTMLATALAATTLGLLVGAVSKTSEQANNLGMILGFVLSIVGGFPLPWFTLGGVMGFISNFTPHAHAIQAFKGLTVEFLPLMQVMPQILLVFGFAVVFFAVALWRYKFE